MPGISFDRAAGYYDATRGLPEDVRDRVAAVLARELAGRALCLEIGVGTGRIALPLARLGVSLAGVDLAPAMLDRLRANSGGRLPFPLILGDVTDLPMADSSAGAVLSSHVLHLVEDWRTAVDEVCRVLVPGGVLLVDFGGPAPTPWSEATVEILARHGVFRIRPGVSRMEPLADYLADRASPRALPPVEMSWEARLVDDLQEWETQILAWTWPYSPEQMREACSDIRRSAPRLGWSLEEEVPITQVIQWWAFDLAR
jgi:ubiquinone/menaquinone biosynthesis C-methylase UbiE